MKKDFSDWFPVKQFVQNNDYVNDLYFREGEIWWCYLGKNIGSEQDGKGVDYRRPVLVLKKFNQLGFLGVPLSKQIKKNKYFIPCVVLQDSVERCAILSQVKVLDSKRLIDKLGSATPASFSAIKKALRDMIL